MERKWKYYQAIAEKYGTDKDGKETNFSLMDFFEVDAAHQNPLVRAFLGDQRAFDSLNWDAPLPAREQVTAFTSSVTPPYEAQITAIQKAIAQPVSIVHGPPGTGKTETILNLLSVIHGLDPTRTVAVVSSNSEAIRNITDKIREGKAHDEMLAVLDRNYAILGNKTNRSKWKTEMERRGEDTGCFDSDLTISPELLTRYPIFTSTIHSLHRNFLEEDGSFRQFDYVIVDECSMISCFLGLVAMGCAKQLVLFGDEQQLPPIIKEHLIEDVQRQYEDVPEIYKESEEHTFLTACTQVFGSKISPTLLNQHYRCHPAIIGFCNEYVYDGQLQVMQQPDGRFPIRVTWYEGDYCEKFRGNGEHADIRNMRQQRIFMEEEWEPLLERLEREEELSVCVISPFYKPLELLYKELSKDVEARNLPYNPVLEVKDEKEGRKIPQLSIHKVQGRGYDVVYFLTAEDYSQERWPWSQKRRMINVAVSRAKKEFRIITSSQWLPEEMQKELTGYVLPTRKPDDPDGEKDNLFIKKLLAYTACHVRQDGEFGFHKSEISSVFDKVPQYRHVFGTKKKNDSQYSAPARCMRDALYRSLSGEYKICCEMPLKHLYPPSAEQDAEIRDYIEAARVDFAICKNNDVLLVLEVDGAQHRDPDMKPDENGHTQAWRDEVKDACLRKAGVTSWRIPTNGETEDELAQIRELLAYAEQEGKHVRIAPELRISTSNATRAEYRRDLLLRYLKNHLLSCLDGLKACTAADPVPEPVRRTLATLKYDDDEETASGQSNEPVPYRELLLNQFYFCRYGIAYAFEYAMLYRILLRAYGGAADEFGVNAFGCGGFLDAWSLAYEKNQLIAENPERFRLRLRYTGIDINIWAHRLFEPETQEKTLQELFPEFRTSYAGMVGFCETQQEITDPVLMFPKLLNELDEATFEAFLTQLRRIRFPSEEYYLCISHSRSDLVEGMARTDRILSALNRNREFEITDDLSTILGNAEYQALREYLFSDTGTDIMTLRSWKGARKSYVFRWSREEETYIRKLRYEFECEEIYQYLRALAPKLEQDGIHTMQVTKCKHIAFQIIRLKRKHH